MMKQLRRSESILTMSKVGMISLGCAKNRVNSEQMLYLLREAGYDVSGDTYGADAAVVNTCAFIESAKTEAIDTILQLASEKASGNLGAIVVAGCLPQRHKEDIMRELPEIDAVIGTGSFDKVADVIGSILQNKDSSPAPVSAPNLFGDINAPVSETRRIISTSKYWAYLKIAEGCNNRCSYCCIPDIRGRFRSRPIGAIVKEAVHLAGAGYKELILVAQDTTAYGTDIYGQSSLVQLLRELGKIEEQPWIRLLYLYPDAVSDALIDEISNNDTIVKYFDIPIQHINDRILRSMNRRGTGDDIRKLIIKIRERVPGAVLRTSLITGLPGEGDKEFEELCMFLKDAEIERAGVFAYSPEEGTEAASMKRVAKKTAQRRAREIQKIQSQIMESVNAGRIGTITRVLYDHTDAGRLLCRSYAEAPEVDGYIAVKQAAGHRGFKDKKQFPPQNIEEVLFDIRITGAEKGTLIGKRVV